MGFGAIIPSEDQNTPLSDDLLKWLVEARVEQELSAPTRFATRFEDDTCERSLQVLKAKEIKPNTVMAILAPDDNKLACLVRGRVTQVRFAVMLGVAGSWVEIRGEDRRIEMDRNCVHKAWRGLASDAANTILNDYHFTRDVEATKKLYSDREHTLNQRDTVLAFLERIARENGYEFWIEYGVKDSASTPGAPIGIDETAKLRASPPRDAAPVPPILLALPGAPSLHVNVPPDQCPNVTSFQVDTDVERASLASGAAINPCTGKLEKTHVVNPQPGLDNGPTLSRIDAVKRGLSITTAGGVDELQPKQEAALVEAGWFVEATASTTAHMLGALVNPHEVVPVEGGDPRYPIWSGCFWACGQIDAADAAPSIKFFKTDSFTIRIDDEQGEMVIETKTGSRITVNGTEVKLEAAQVSQVAQTAKTELTPASFSVNNGALAVAVI